jgi:hypothetical protein
MYQAYFADPAGVLTVLGHGDTAVIARDLCVKHLATLIMASDNLIEATKVDDDTPSSRTKVTEHVPEPDGWVFYGAKQPVVRGYLGVVETRDTRSSYASEFPALTRAYRDITSDLDVPRAPSQFPRELIDELTLKLRHMKEE